MSQRVNRRAFSKTAVDGGAAATAMSLAPGRVLGANDQVRLGFIGVGNRGCQLLKGFLAHADAKIVALCDVYEPYLNGRLRSARSAVRRPGQAHRPDAQAGGGRRPRQGFPRDSRSQRHRRRRDRHTRPLARDPDDRRLQGGQGRLRREAVVDRRSSKAGRWSTRPASTSGSCRSARIDVRRGCMRSSPRWFTPGRSARSPWRAPPSRAT